MKRGRRSVTAEFKADAVSLVQQQGYTVAKACQVLGIGEPALRRWVEHVAVETVGLTPSGRAITPEQQRIQALEAQVVRRRSRGAAGSRARAKTLGVRRWRAHILMQGCHLVSTQPSKPKFRVPTAEAQAVVN